MSNDITAILNGYKRPKRLREQLDALSKQSIQPTNIFYWQNSMPGIQYDSESANKCISAFCNTNFGVWSRFYYAMNARTNWVCIFDDDTIPGSLWLENCLNTFEKSPGLLGTIGVVFPENNIYHNVKRIGWDNPNEETQEVDIVGHSWFFHRDMLSIFARELPPIDQVPFVGEDIHFSRMLQKYSNYKTLVPPHPRDNRELWGSLKGWEYGDDGLATASTCIEYMRKDLTRALENGFKLINHA
jgi:hypothetical protein